jgi:hypothetical protein
MGNPARFGKQEGYHAPHIIRNGTITDDSRMRWVAVWDRSNAVHLRLQASRVTRDYASQRHALRQNLEHLRRRAQRLAIH